MTPSELILDPFTQYAFMRRALAACVILAIGGTPLGVFMTLRRMTLMGDAMSHAILPGVALAFASFGLALLPMTLGGLAAGVFVALCAMFLTRFTRMKEDASFTLLYLMSLAAGVIIISLKGSNVDLMHMLFGNILAIDKDSLTLMAGVACVTLFTLAGFYRGLVIDCFDPDFAYAAKRGRSWASLIFFVLLVTNLIAAFQALGTLMALGLMILPAIAARFWTQNIDTLIPLSILCALAASLTGLLISYYTQIPAGPAVVLAAGTLSLFSALSGTHGSVYAYVRNLD
ncbi:MAG: metal ABC transporter permease [Alphaproteobacteria bacterium]|nr:metal ABC transporter permease [Alphaproteobacteria bacterium]